MRKANVLTIIAAAGVLAFALRGPGKSPVGDEGEGRATGRAAAAHANDDSSDRAEAETRRYALRLASKAELRLPDGSGDGVALAQEVEQEVQGALSWTVVRRDPTGRDVLVSIRDARVRLAVDGRSAAEAARAMSRSLAVGALARYDQSGHLVGVSVPEGFDPTAEALVRSLLTTVQVVKDDRAVASWEVAERDGTGSYEARYAVRAATSAGVRLVKTKTRYTEVRQAAAGLLELAVQPGGELAIEIDAGSGALHRVQGEETLSLTLAGGVSLGGSSLAIDLALEEKEPLPESELSRLREAVAQRRRASPEKAVDDTRAAAHAARTMHERELGGRTFADLARELAEASGDDEESEAKRRKVYTRLRSLMILDPRAARDVAGHAAGVDPESRAFTLLVGAMQSVGHAEAQAGLVDLIDASAGKPRVVQALAPSLAMVEHPTEASERRLRELAASDADQGVRDAARLALGIVASKLGEADPTRAGALLAEATAGAATARAGGDEAALALQLAVLGNTAAVEALPEILPHLADASPALRREAVNALRLIPGDEAETRLVDALRGDASEEVRFEAAAALGHRPPSVDLVAAQRDLYRAEASVAVRMKLVQNVFDARAAAPEESRSFLREVAAEARDEDLRALARRLAAGA